MRSALSSSGRLVAARYLLIATFINVLWEALQLPLYTIWTTASDRYLACAVVHCSGGDTLILLMTLSLSILLVGGRTWPRQGYGRVALAATVLGVSYVVLSEWLNVQVFRTWAYSPAMPVLPPLDTGLSPLAQWLVIPPIVLCLVRPAPARHDLDQGVRHKSG